MASARPALGTLALRNVARGSAALLLLCLAAPASAGPNLQMARACVIDLAPNGTDKGRCNRCSANAECTVMTCLCDDRPKAMSLPICPPYVFCQKNGTFVCGYCQ